MILATLVFACSAPHDSHPLDAPLESHRPLPWEPPEPRATPPNVLVILLDDVGTDVVSGYAEHPLPAQTPNLDALAEQGMRFRDAWSTPVCSPARGALLTGRFGRRDGVGEVIHDGDDYELPDSELTIPEMLAGAPDAWDRSEIGKWHLAVHGPDEARDDDLTDPGDKGFPWYHSVAASLEPGQSYYRWSRNDNGALGTVERYVTTDQIDDAIDRVAEMEEPWLLYLPITADHEPWSAPPPDLAGPDDDVPAGPARLYHRTLEATDAELGRLLAEVDLDRTLVFALGDNGTPGSVVLPPRDPDQAKSTLYEGGVNVPFVVAGPGVAAGTKSRALVSVADLFPTVAEIAGLDPTAFSVDGRSLAPNLADPSAPGAETVYSERFLPLGFGPYDEDERAIREARFKYVVDEITGEERLFDLQGRDDDGPDLLDQPLAPDARSALRRLRVEMRGWREALAR